MTKVEREVVQRLVCPTSLGVNGAECDEPGDNVVAESVGGGGQYSAKRKWSQGVTREYWELEVGEGGVPGEGTTTETEKRTP